MATTRGKGLYAARDLQAGWELFYCGRYYATWAHLVAAGRNTGQDGGGGLRGGAAGGVGGGGTNHGRG